MPDESYRVLCHGIHDTMEEKIKSFKAVLEDSVTNLKNIGDLDLKIKENIDLVVSTARKNIRSLTQMENALSQLRAARILESHGISVVTGNESQTYRSQVTNYLEQLFELLNTQLRSSYSTRIYDFPKYYEQHDPYQKILVEIDRERQIYFADCIKGIHSLLGRETDTIFDEFLENKHLNLDLPKCKYIALYFRILNGYVTGLTNQIPYFSLCYLEDLDQNPLEKEREQFNLKKISRPTTAKERLTNKALDKQIEETNMMTAIFDIEHRPIFEKYYHEALNILEQIKVAQIEKQTEPADDGAFTKTNELDDGAAIVTNTQEGNSIPPTMSINASNETEIDDTEKVETGIDDNEETEIEKMLRTLQQQYAEDRAVKSKKTKKKEKISDIETNVSTTIVAPSHTQKEKLREEFWTAEIMPWLHFKKFMTEIIGGILKKNGGGSHYKVKLSDTVSIPVCRPHKFGSSKVGSGQLNFIRGILRENNIDENFEH